MVMQKLFVVFGVTLMASGCVSHPAQYQSLLVTLKNNEPCFAIPADSGVDAPVTSHSPTIMRRAGNEWKAISPPSTFSPEVTLTTQQCHQWTGITWQAGEYDVALKVSGKNGFIRYAARFILEEGPSGRFKLFIPTQLSGA
ncbi:MULTISPECIES: putative T6SS immunity periplasmic lipoprotein [Enterobacter]|uniref:Lipoprotein n=1 Tax=Enterobacter cloacae TaxID=550 RepID=A0A330GCL6_ENTCL|nr:MULTISPECIES: putative T6SS immunity periplasmic lipoprotein [Enterobacter cloacae complex]MEC5766078.1 hypothetical protein [Enterobacter chengduensis]NBC77845.1 hypothetical protein [Enterobacter asburiae]RAZ67546.1 hypothetical protein DP202_11805 [Enterobacter cloacae]HBM9901978.1 hypothetical protein [Enterobacter chengduensis]